MDLGTWDELESYSRTGRLVPRAIQLFDSDLVTSLVVGNAMEVMLHTNDPGMLQKDIDTAGMHLKSLWVENCLYLSIGLFMLQIIIKRAWETKAAQRYLRLTTWSE